MAHAANIAATKYKALHSELRIPWGVAPFPPRPREGEAIESLARNARYQLMFDAMIYNQVDVLATGHHADDQVETVLMRLGAGSTILGLGGMRPLRRFGMALGKGENDFGWFGHEGLNRWIVRPLLDVSKDRILATCDSHNIPYILDYTNFQPELTLRNAIRHVLSNNEQEHHISGLNEGTPPLPPVLADKIIRMKTASENLKIPIPIDLTTSRENLHAAVRCSSRNLSDIESKALILTAFPSKLPLAHLFSLPTSFLHQLRIHLCN
ncbi:PP-loop family-domain-containing protein [Multifurca ochricompacta]|uniref:tRNA(Ile)-lysidine synthetase n=1 Tax=Multifurca ochricompacta TaxID=376703 RepID=A0AAD4M9R1_9AGAM|nr:PP-loop family-domain-containing protein [Multifurca ochricompacta]